MEGIHHAYILRVKRADAGMKIPFDKVYLFHKNDRELLPRVFKDAMVFPLTQHWVTQITKVLEVKPSFKAFAFNRFGEDGLLKRIQKQNPLVGIEKERENYVALVPVLFTKHGSKVMKTPRHKGRKKVVSYAAYIVARPTRSGTVSLMKQLLSARAYFLMDGRAIKPICLMCPRHQYFLQGECTLGEQDCYTHLSQARPNDMVRGVALYDELMQHIKEPQLELPEQEVTA